MVTTIVVQEEKYWCCLYKNITLSVYTNATKAQNITEVSWIVEELSNSSDDSDDDKVKVRIVTASPFLCACFVNHFKFCWSHVLGRCFVLVFYEQLCNLTNGIMLHALQTSFEIEEQQS